ncbi:type II toxin-antitoxin system VapC family toxin [Kribbella qitaiheensis]|uniref:Type II toxin-antitoxin system VapC family toxin n=1 Tax=Kribbella qitaiheensis TaxID=1544730 RepID=A0A7G6X216_9ACTN|nr:type II toxin-antitoxin system VapC family toxin [Kribbella qitaiheensis]QNE20281.1 type II toxin-antitoxin system VapC family toxin [Kribbella qitaiheensis]
MASERRLGLVDPVVTLIDSCALLDVLTGDPTWGDWSAGAIAKAETEGELVINPLIYAEVSAGYAQVEQVDAALPPAIFRREPLPYAAGFLAAKAFIAYRKRGGTKAAPLPDFYIGAHAAVAHYRVITRDASRFRTYFPGLELVTPN